MPDTMSDSEKLIVLAAWFDMWDEVWVSDRQRLLDDESNPGKNDVQADLRRIAGSLVAAAVQRTVTEDAERLARVIMDNIAYDEDMGLGPCRYCQNFYAHEGHTFDCVVVLARNYASDTPA